MFSAFFAVEHAHLINLVLSSNIWMRRMLYIGISVLVAVDIYFGILRLLGIVETEIVWGLFGG